MQKPDKRFVVEINDLNAITPWIPKITPKRWLQFQLIFFCEFLSNLGKLLFITNHDPEMPHVRRLHPVHFENREELMFTQFEKGIALAAVHLFEIENILV